jgi:hypothetical protein
MHKLPEARILGWSRWIIQAVQAAMLHYIEELHSLRMLRDFSKKKC